MNLKHYDVAIIGAGILGLAHAYHFARRGLSVVVFERTERAVGASVRNFGMVWPIGQPPGEMREMALRSRQHWLNALGSSGIWHQLSGSLHLCYAEDEWAVLEEFAQRAPALGYECTLLTPGETREKSPYVRLEGLLGALWSPSEVCVFPRQVIWELPEFLVSLGVEFRFGTAVTQVESGKLAAGGTEVSAGQIVLCSGDDFETLLPEEFKACGMTRSKLQMLRMKSDSPDFAIGAHLCAGLTLGHYANFRVCDSLPALLGRYEVEMPEYVRHGIHLLVSQHADGQITVGDSHHYGLDVTPYLDAEVERLILSYLDSFLPTAGLSVTERWYGVYAKHPSKSYVLEHPIPGVTIATGVGGAGMTLSFGFAEKVVNEILQ